MIFDEPHLQKQAQSFANPPFTTNVPNRRLSDSLQPMLEVLQPMWIRNFLFTNNPFQVPMLSSIPNSTSPLSFFMHNSTTSSPTDPSNSVATFADDHRKNDFWILCPLFTAADYTCGIGASEELPANPETWPSLCKVRFVRNTITRTLLVVVDFTEDGSFLLFCTRLESTQQSTSCRIFFNGSIRSVALDATQNFQLQNVLRSIVKVQDEVRRRPCIVCKVQPEAICACSFPVSHSLHPLDTRFFSMDMKQHCTAMEAVSVASGSDLYKSLLGSRISVRSVLDAEITRRLYNWSLTTYGHTLPQHPQNPAPLPLFPPKEGIGNRILSVEHSHPQGSNPVLHRSASSRPYDTLIRELGLGGAVSADVINPGLPNVYPAVDLISVSEAATTTRPPQQDQAYSDSEESPNTHSAERVGLEGSGSDITMNTDVVKNSMPGADPNTNTATELSVQEIRRNIELSIRDEKRRERNRASARRSNLKKKRYREQLDAELGASQHHLATLRRRELLLRQENKNLRQLLQQENNNANEEHK